jgi:hypothetical protein
MSKRMTYADEHEARANMEGMGTGMSVAEQRMIVAELDETRGDLAEMCEHATTHGYAALATEMRRRGRAPIGQPPPRTEPSAPSVARRNAKIMEPRMKETDRLSARRIAEIRAMLRTKWVYDVGSWIGVVEELMDDRDAPSAPSPDDEVMKRVAEAVREAESYLESLADASLRARRGAKAYYQTRLDAEANAYGIAAQYLRTHSTLGPLISTARRTASAKDGAE